MRVTTSHVNKSGPVCVDYKKERGKVDSEMSFSHVAIQMFFFKSGSALVVNFILKLHALFFSLSKSKSFTVYLTFKSPLRNGGADCWAQAYIIQSYTGSSSLRFSLPNKNQQQQQQQKKTVLNPLLMHHRTHAKASVKMPSHFFLASVTTV